MSRSSISNIRAILAHVDHLVNGLAARVDDRGDIGWHVR
jgi:hypothetical protein